MAMAMIIRTSLLLTFYLHCVNSNIFITDLSSSPSILEECTLLCKQSFIQLKKVASSESCSRGCRFYGIAALITANKHPEFNISQESCHNCCYESYTDHDDKGACNMGCDTMAKRHRILRLNDPEVAIFSIFQEDEVGIIVDSGDLMDTDDFLTDLALRHHLGVDMLTDGNKLPEMRVKTLPVNSDMMVRGEWWSDCSVKKVGVSRCLAASMLVLLILLILWFALSCDDKATLPSPNLFNFDQAPPLPPKYSTLDNVPA